MSFRYGDDGKINLYVNELWSSENGTELTGDNERLIFKALNL